MNATLQALLAFVASLRLGFSRLMQINDASQAKQIALRNSGDRYAPAWLAAEQARIREAALAEATAYVKERDFFASIERWLKTRPMWELAVFIRNAKFADALGAAPTVTDGDRFMINGIQTVAEQLIRLRWMAELDEMDETDLRAVWQDGIASKNLALLGLIQREVGCRCRCSGADDATYRALAVEFQRDLEALDIPEITQARDALDEIRELGSDIQSELSATAKPSGDSPGRRSYAIWQMRREGVTSPGGWSTTRDSAGNAGGDCDGGSEVDETRRPTNQHSEVMTYERNTSSAARLRGEPTAGL